jgi:hypothetical protein
MPAQKIGALIANEPALKPLLTRLAEINSLERIYFEAVPVALARSSQVSSYENGTLVIAAENGAVAAKLKQLLPTLTQAFVVKGIEVTAIRLAVQVPGAVADSVGLAPARKPALAHSAAQSCRELADTLPESPLREALQRLARRGRKSRSAR